MLSPQEFNIEKLHLLEAEKAKIRKDFERREGQIEVKKKIDYSKQLNASRIKVSSRNVRTMIAERTGLLDEAGRLLPVRCCTER